MSNYINGELSNKAILRLRERGKYMTDRLKTFTEEEKRLAEKNHDLVYQFLKSHNYNMEDYYNIVVFGYLKGIQKYCRYVGNNTENNLAGICWNCMRSEMKKPFQNGNSEEKTTSGNNYDKGIIRRR